MSKSVIVIDTPETCVDCIFCQEYGIGSKKICILLCDQWG